MSNKIFEVLKLNEKQIKFIQLRVEGHSYRYIAKAINVSRNTLPKWEEEFRSVLKEIMQRERTKLLTNFKAIETERIKSLGNVLARVRKELKTRDLSGIKTEKLIDLEIKLLKELGTYSEFPLNPRTDEEIILQHNYDRYERDSKEIRRIEAEGYQVPFKSQD